MFLCLTPAAFLASISVAATHTHTHSLTLKSAEKTKNYKEEAEAEAEGGSRRREQKRREKGDAKTVTKLLWRRSDKAGQKRRRGAGQERGKHWWPMSLVATLATACCMLPAACCGGSHFICLLIKSCDTYKCPSGVNTFACMSSASQPPLPPPFPPLFPLSLFPLSSLTRTACSTNECQERVKICA